jgi:WG repeat protein
MIHYIIVYTFLLLFGSGLSFMTLMIYRYAYKSEKESKLLKIIFWGFTLVFITPFLCIAVFLIKSDVSEYLDQKENESIRFGYIDRSGKTVIPFEFIEAGSFENGFALVKKNSASYWIDSLGNKAKNQDRHYLNKPIERRYYELIGGSCTTYDYEHCIDGELKIKDTTSEGLNLVRLVRRMWTSNKGYHYMDVRWGFQDTTGKMIITPVFLGAFSFREGLAAVIEVMIPILCCLQTLIKLK